MKPPPTAAPNPKAFAAAKSGSSSAKRPPARPEDFRYLGTDTRTPYLSEFDPEDGGELAHYYLRWVNTRDEPGPWSDPISGSILA